MTPPVYEKIPRSLLLAGAIPTMSALVLPPALVLLWAAREGQPGLPVVVSWQSVLVFGMLALGSAGIGLAGGLASRSWARVAFATSLLVLLAWGVCLRQNHFAGTMSLGVGEPSAQYTQVVAGPSAKAPTLSLEVLGVSGGRTPGCEVLLDQEPRKLRVGETLVAKGGSATLREVHAAPMFFIEERDGKRSVEGYLKLGEGPEENPYFQFGVLPHRFYLAPVADGDTASVGSGAIPAQRLHLQVTRGKLVLVDREVAAGEKVVVDGFSVGFEPGSGWVLLRVVTVSHRWPLILAAGLFAVAALTGWRRRGRA